MMKLHLQVLLLCSACLTAAAVAAAVSQHPQNETTILLSLSKLLPGLNTTSSDPCSWSFVTCSPSPNPRVTTLSLSGTATNSTSSTTLFSLLCNLSSLHSLDLSRNSLTSFIKCAGLSTLKTLNLSTNTFSGPLPSFSPSLETLDLSNNFFTTINTQLKSLSRLKSLNLSSNQFRGPIPTLHTDYLEELKLSDNVFTGHFPDLLRYRNLTVLDLSVNNLTGPLPPSITSLQRLQTLILSSNSLTGSIPNLNTDYLEELILSDNFFTGHFPDLRRYRNLTVLDLSVNNLTGPLPTSITSLQRLQTLILSSNNLSGSIPAGLSNITTLTRFSANQNMFIGSIPVYITRHLQLLDLSYNHLTGELPSDLLTGTKLESIDLTTNRLEGHIPVNSSSQSLYRLRLGQNMLTGRIPPAIGNLLSLTYLELDSNILKYEIPRELANCKNLSLLNLASNSLGGKLPEEIAGLQQLVVVKLQMNNLSGNIPSGLFSLHKLNILNLSRNSLTGKIPDSLSELLDLSSLNLEGNRLVGSIPTSIKQLGALLELQLGSNQLSGVIPLMPITLSTALNLSGNLLSGSIPSFLGDLGELEILDLSDNKLTGNVPTSLTQIKSLTQLVLSNNQLSGVLPSFGQWVVVKDTGNIDLKQASENNMTYSQKKNHTTLLIIVGISSALVVFGSTVAVFFLFVWKRVYRVEDISSQSDENPFQIANSCLLTSSSIHKSSIDFAKALEVVANPANVTLKTRFSTYYKADMPNGVRYFVKKIDWRDKIFPAGSGRQLRRELEALGGVSSSNVMAPLAYVLTEESAYLFYENVYKGTVYDFLHKGSENALDWPSRYSIALGVAHGLAFLHGGDQPVLLLDLTSKSIHLKSLTEPQIGDIELCNVIDPTKSVGSLSTVAGSVGYIPPEYAYTMRLTKAGNIYSFGVVLLELLTGKPPVSRGNELAKWALSHSSRMDEREQIIDPILSRTSILVQDQMLSVLKVALDCVSSSPEARPKTRKVLRMLFNARQ